MCTVTTCQAILRLKEEGLDVARHTIDVYPGEYARIDSCKFRYDFDKISRA